MLYCIFHILCGLMSAALHCLLNLDQCSFLSFCLACCVTRLACILQVLEPLQMACTMDVPRIAEPALGCLHKLVRASCHLSKRHHSAELACTQASP